MKRILVSIIFIVPAALLGQVDTVQKIFSTIDLKQYFREFEGGFSIYDMKSGKYHKYNSEHCQKRFSPCSTFKIPNSLIGLETGAATDSGFVIPYDSLLHPRNEMMLNTVPFKYWFQDLSMRAAFKYSCVWYYQELARRIGTKRMNAYIELMKYGNNDISSGIDNFWLCGSMQISIDEQIEFLKKLYTGHIPGLSSNTIKAVKDIMLYETTDNYKLYGKTGGGNCWKDKVIGWYVGFIETESETYIFAMNIMVNDFDDLKDNFRIELTKKILKGLEIIK